jgi:predicted amidohydrolase
MQNVRVALAQIAPMLGEVERNLALHLETADRAARGGAEVVVFPELSLTGYLLRDQVPDVAREATSPTLAELARASAEVDLVVGFVEEAEGHRFFNSAGYFSGGRLVAIRRKLYLPTYGMFDEGRDFASGETMRAFRTAHGPVGLLICEDAWHPTTAWLLAQDGAEILYTLSSGPTRGARPGRGVTSVGVWRDLLRSTAQFQTSFVVYVNRVGYEDGVNFGGGSFVVDPFGRVLAELPSLDPSLEIVELSAEVLRRARTAYPLLRDERIELVYRELGRIRASRFGLDDASSDDPETPREEVGS